MTALPVAPLAVLNRYRTAAGLAPLIERARLTRLAERRAGEIVRHYAHAAGLPASEVLTVGRFDAEGLIWEWLSWPTHRAILLDPPARRAGFGSVAQGGQTYWVGLIGGDL